MTAGDRSTAVANVILRRRIRHGHPNVVEAFLPPISVEHLAAW